MHERRTQASLLACVFYYTIKAEREVKEMDYYNNPYMARYQSLQMPEMFRGQITEGQRIPPHSERKRQRKGVCRNG